MQPSRPLVWSNSLALASKIHSEDMAVNNFFAHESPSTGTLSERIHGAGYQYEEAGENLAGGQTTIGKTVNDWLKSPSHCANLLNTDFLDMGAACKKIPIRTTKPTGPYKWHSLRVHRVIDEPIDDDSDDEKKD